MTKRSSMAKEKTWRVVACRMSPDLPGGIIGLKMRGCLRRSPPKPLVPINKARRRRLSFLISRHSDPGAAPSRGSLSP